MTHYSNTSNPVDFPKLSTIDRLWGEALDRAVPDTYSSLTWTQVEKIKSVFAELIVRECAMIATQQSTGYSYPTEVASYVTAGKVSSAKMIKQHFGVEE